MLNEISKSIIKMWFAIRFYWSTPRRTRMESNEYSFEITKPNKVCSPRCRRKKEKENRIYLFHHFGCNANYLFSVSPDRAWRRLWFFNFSFILISNDLSVWNIDDVLHRHTFQWIWNGVLQQIRLSLSFPIWDHHHLVITQEAGGFFRHFFHRIMLFAITIHLKCDTCFANACSEINQNVSVTKIWKMHDISQIRKCVHHTQMSNIAVIAVRPSDSALSKKHLLRVYERISLHTFLLFVI